ncbi:MAG: MATE family efflux transporter, partial [Acidaminococcaceae bacterium]
MVTTMTAGKPLKLILSFTIPLIIGNIFQQMYNIADVIIVGQTIGINALAAVGSTIPLFMVLMGSTVGLTGGFAVITGQCFGAGDMVGVRKSAAVSAVLSGIFSVLIMVAAYLCLPAILALMQVPAAIYADAYSYISILIYGISALTLYNLLASLLRALGDSKTPLYFLIIASILNIALALVFIRNFGWGVPGSAIALVIAEGISGLLCLAYIYWHFPLLHLQREDWQITWRAVREHLAMGLPMALQFTILGVGILVLQAVCNSFGPEVIAGFTSAMRIEQLALQPMISIGLTIAV